MYRHAVDQDLRPTFGRPSSRSARSRFWRWWLDPARESKEAQRRVAARALLHRCRGGDGTDPEVLIADEPAHVG